jgi:hypothetical protein
MEEPRFLITSEQVSDYVVCPESWRLKFVDGDKYSRSIRNEEGIIKRKEWVEQHDLLTSLRKYAKIVYLLLVLLTIIVFLLEYRRSAKISAKPTPAPKAIGIVQ